MPSVGPKNSQSFLQILRIELVPKKSCKKLCGVVHNIGFYRHSTFAELGFLEVYYHVISLVTFQFIHLFITWFQELHSMFTTLTCCGFLISPGLDCNMYFVGNTGCNPYISWNGFQLCKRFDMRIKLWTCVHPNHFYSHWPIWLVSFQMSQPHFEEMWGRHSHSRKWDLGVLWDSRNLIVQL
jgi:hypothetical protein